MYIDKTHTSLHKKLYEYEQINFAESNVVVLLLFLCVFFSCVCVLKCVRVCVVFCVCVFSKPIFERKKTS